MPGGATTFEGWDPRGAVAARADAAAEFAGPDGPAPVVASRYELLAVAQRGFRPPRFLSATPDSAPTRAAQAPAPEPGGFRQTFSLEYRELTATAPAGVAPFAIYLLGVNPPAGASPEELEVFNDFYTRVHLVEVAERRRALRAVRYELVAATRAPYQPPPRYLAIYEVDEEGAARRRHTGPPYRSGPEVWQRHTTPWRLWYRVLGSAP